MRVGDAYFTEEHRFGETEWYVDVIKRIDGQMIWADVYYGGPTKPWKFDSEYPRPTMVFLDLTPMSELEKQTYNFSEINRTEEFNERDIDRGTSKKNSQLGILGMGGIVVAFMMMR